MKQAVTAAVIAVLAIGLGVYLFSISPSERRAAWPAPNFDLSLVKPKSDPAPLGTEDRIWGNPQAKNTLMAYEDFQCPACALQDEIFKQLAGELPDTKFVFRYFPLYQIHKNAVSSIYAAEAAGEQGKYWEVHKLLFDNQSSWSELDDPMPVYEDLARQAGVPDLGKFAADTRSGKYQDRVERDLVDALSLNLPGTPSLFYNGLPLRTGSAEQIKEQIRALGLQSP